jgi:hypothetical protein
MSFSYTKVWEETVRTLRANGSLLVAVAGVFIFLPTLVAAYLAPAPQTQTMQAIGDYYSENFGVLLIAQLISFIGNLAVLTLVLDERRPTVGGSIGAAFAMLPAYFLVSLISGLMILGGLLLLIVPGLYLVGRLAATGPALVAEGRRNPFDIIGRSFALTKGRGWAVLGLIALVFIAFWVLTMAVTVVVGSIFLVIDRVSGGGIGAFLVLILTSATTAAFNTVLMVLVASLYRSLVGAGTQASVPPTSGI